VRPRRRQVIYPGPRQVCPTSRSVGSPCTWAISPRNGAARAALVGFRTATVAASRRFSRRCCRTRWLRLGQGPTRSGSPGVGQRAGVCRSCSVVVLRRLRTAGRAAGAVDPYRRSADCSLEARVHRLAGVEARRPVADRAGRDRRQGVTNCEWAKQVEPSWRSSIHRVTHLLVDDVLTTERPWWRQPEPCVRMVQTTSPQQRSQSTQKRGISVGGAAHVGDLRSLS
jgi:hypothetical protein